MKMKTIISVLTAISLSLSLGASPVLAAADYYHEKEHSPVSFSDMVYEGVDTTALDGYIRELESLADAKDQDEARLAELYTGMIDEFDHVFTQQSLCYIARSKKGDDKKLAGEYEKIEQVLIDVNDRANVVLAKIAGTKLGPALEALLAEDFRDEEKAADILRRLLEYEPLTDREKEIAAKLASLRTEYNEVSLASYTVKVNGETWTSEEFAEAPPEDDDTYYAVQNALNGALNEAAADIYLDMIPLLNEGAELQGYDNYADYANAEVYDRDYSAEDQRALAEDVKEYLVPLLEEISSAIDADSYYELDGKIAQMSGDEMLDMIAPFIADIHPDLEASFDYMRTHGLYDLDAAEGKLDVGYTTGLDEYGAAFIFNNPYGSFSDFSGATVHEFGHYNEAYYTVVPAFWQESHLDVSEIASQGLEILLLHYAEDMFGEEEGAAYRDGVVYDLLSAVLSACKINDFETEVFTSDKTWTRDSLNELFYELCEEYGDEPESVEDCWWWTGIHHIYESPFYYISYGTSALGAMDIAGEAWEDWEKGVDRYLRLTSYASMYPLRETLEKSELRDIFDEGAVEEIADSARDMLDLTERGGGFIDFIFDILDIFFDLLL